MDYHGYLWIICGYPYIITVRRPFLWDTCAVHEKAKPSSQPSQVLSSPGKPSQPTNVAQQSMKSVFATEAKKGPRFVSPPSDTSSKNCAKYITNHAKQVRISTNIQAGLQGDKNKRSPSQGLRKTTKIDPEMIRILTAAKQKMCCKPSYTKSCS